MLHCVIAIFSIVGLVYGVYQFLVSFIGTIKRKKTFAHAGTHAKFAVLIPARNEEKVIQNIVRDLLAQDYPAKCLDIYVLPNNCTDDTQAVASDAGAEILLIDVPVKSKGEVLNYAFEKLSARGGHDAYLIFDADNRIDPGFVSAANDALSAGYQVGQAYRDSVNADAHWIAGNSSEFFWFMNRLYNQARFALNISASLNGTGIMVSEKVIREVHFSVDSLTEDLEFTAICALNGVKICFMREAILYDEQPTSVRDSVIQRRRWTAGTLQCFRKYALKLVLCAVRHGSASAFDILTVFAGPIVQLFSAVPFTLTVALIIRDVIVKPDVTFWMAAQALAMMLLGTVLGCAAFVLLICILEKKMCLKRLRDMFTMPLFLFSWMLINFYCLISKPPKWVQIRHGEEKTKKPKNPSVSLPQ